jgi:hypothetical protein
MFCPKCGAQNPEAGVFCRSCGTRLTNATAPLGVGGTAAQVNQLVGRRGRPVSYESAGAKLFTGLAFIIIACILGWTGNGHGWWFWMLIPGFASFGKGIAQWMQIRNAGQGAFVSPTIAPEDRDRSVSAAAAPNLPPAQQQWATSESRYKTGDLVPPSVTETTTRHLDLNKEGETMTLPTDKN